VRDEERSQRELGGEALRQRVQRGERAVGLREAALRDEVGHRPAHPPGEAVGPGHERREVFVAARRSERRFERRARRREVGRQRRCERLGEARDALLQRQWPEAVDARAFEAPRREAGQHGAKARGQQTRHRRVDAVFERFGHAGGQGVCADGDAPTTAACAFGGQVASRVAAANAAAPPAIPLRDGRAADAARRWRA
jgi:hypothetical protein